MKKLTVIFTVAVMLLPALRASSNEVETATGTLQINAAAKFLYGYAQRDDQTRTPGRDDFATSLADVAFSGDMGKNLSYRIELAASWSRDFPGGFQLFVSNPNELGSAGVRQAYITIKGVVPWTTFKVGTFIPPITNYGPRQVWDLDLIQYPLLNNASRMNTGLYGNHPAARDLGVWQQAGINATIQLPYMIRFDFGVWNGMMPDHEGNFNPDLGMARSVVATFQPVDSLSLSMAWWGERFLQSYPGIAHGARRDMDLWFLSGAYQTDVLEVTADYGTGIIAEYQLDKTGAFQDLNWESWQITAGYWVLPQLEVLARYETINPNAKDSVKIPASLYDQSTWTTIGLNCRVTEQSELSINYVFKDEEGIDVHKGRAGQDPLLPAYNPKYDVQNNDLLLIQVQMWQ